MDRYCNEHEHHNTDCKICSEKYNLLPCPFCGATEKTINDNTGQLALEVWDNSCKDETYQVMCGICESRGSEGKHDKHAIELWNNRMSVEFLEIMEMIDNSDRMEKSLVRKNKTINYLRNENEHLKKYTAHLIDCDNLLNSCIVCEHNNHGRFADEDRCEFRNTEKCNLKKCSCGLEDRIK